jgi:hypothetical protein
LFAAKPIVAFPIENGFETKQFFMDTRITFPYIPNEIPQHWRETSELTVIDTQAAQKIQPELLSGETIYWAGIPNPRVIFHSDD